jgi:hypothetical protein
MSDSKVSEVSKVPDVFEVRRDDGLNDYQMALEEWLGVLSRLWTAFDKPVDPIRLTIYRDALGKVPMGLLEKAIERVLHEHTYSNVPTIGEVWAALRKELHNPYDIDQAIEQWSEGLWNRCHTNFHFEDVAVETAE